MFAKDAKGVHPPNEGAYSLAEASISGDLVMTAHDFRSNLIRTIEGTRRCSLSYIENLTIEDDSKLAGRRGAGAGGHRLSKPIIAEIAEPPAHPPKGRQFLAKYAKDAKGVHPPNEGTYFLAEFAEHGFEVGHGLV